MSDNLYDDEFRKPPKSEDVDADLDSDRDLEDFTKSLDDEYGNGNSSIERSEEELQNAESDDDEDIDAEDKSELSEAQDFYNPDPSKKGSNISGGFSLKNINKKDLWDVSSGGKRIFALVGVGGLLASVLMGFLMFMTVYRSEHIRNLLWDYRFAKFHYQIGKRIRSNLAMVERLNPSSTDTLNFEKTSLGQKMRGFSPEKAMNYLSEGKMELTVEKSGKTGLGESKITGFTDPASGEKIVSERANVRPEGATVVSNAEFIERFNSSATGVLEGANQSKYFQRQTRKMFQDKLKVNFGDRFQEFKKNIQEKLKGDVREPTPDELKESMIGSDLETAQGGNTDGKAGGVLNDAADGVLEDIPKGAMDPTLADVKSGKFKGSWATSPTREKLAKGAGKYGEVSSVVFLVTMGCIVRDISGSINEALTTRIEAPMRMMAGMLGEAEQQKAGGEGASLEAAQVRNRQLDNVEQSAAMQRIVGTPENEITEDAQMQVEDLPFKFFGMDLSTVATISDLVNQVVETAFAGPFSLIPGVDKVTGSVVDWGCKQVLRPDVQLAITIADIAATVLSFGTAKTVSEGIVLGLKTAVQVAGSVGLGKVVFEYFIPKLLFSLAGAGGLLADGDIQNGNKMDLGTTLLASQYGSMAGGTTITNAQAERDQAIAMANIKNNRIKQEGFFAYINPKSPYSLPSQLALSLPGDPLKIPGALISKSIGMITSGSLFSSLGSIISPKAMAADGGVTFETYGVPQTGIPDSMMDIDPMENALYIDGAPGRLQELKNKYQHCFVDTITQKALSGGGIQSTDYSMCDSEDAQRLGLYNIDNCAGAGILTEETNANNCSIFDGAGDVTGEIQNTGNTDIGNFKQGTAVPAVDTSSMSCPTSPTVSEMGVEKVFANDVGFYNIKLCKVHGYTINASKAKDFDSLFTDMKKAGYKPVTIDGKGNYVRDDGGGNFRSYETQAAMHASNPNGAAEAGSSNHERGLAVDIACANTDNSQLYRPWMPGKMRGLPDFRRATSEHPCLNWIHTNSFNYGLLLQCDGTSSSGGEIAAKKGGCETWHLSPTGA